MDSEHKGQEPMAVQSLRRLNLVILDDDPAVVRLVTTFLEGDFAEKFDIVSFTDPTDAQKWINEKCCDVLLSDIEMPGVDGLEMLRFAKGRNSWTQVIFMTGHSSWNHIATAIEQGATDYLVKPIHRHVLVDLLGQAHQRATRWQQAVRETFQRKKVVATT